MSTQQHVTVASGMAVTSAFALAGDRPVVIAIGSHAARAWCLAYAVESPASAWYLGTVVASGAAALAGVVELPATSLARLEVRGGVSLDVDSVLSTTSVMVLGLNRT